MQLHWKVASEEFEASLRISTWNAAAAAVAAALPYWNHNRIQLIIPIGIKLHRQEELYWSNDAIKGRPLVNKSADSVTDNNDNNNNNNNNDNTDDGNTKIKERK